VLTPAGLSLIIAICTCRGHDSPRLRCFRTHACAPHTHRFFLLARTRESAEVREVSSALEPSVGQGRLASEFRLLHEATGGNPLCFSHRRAASNPDQYNPKPPVRVFPKPVYRVDRRENARAADAKSWFWIFAASYLVTVMRPICLRCLLHVELRYDGLHSRSDYARHAILVGSTVRWREREREMLISTRYPVQNYDIWGNKEDWSELHKRWCESFDVVPICRVLISGTFENTRISKHYRGWKEHGGGRERRVRSVKKGRKREREEMSRVNVPSKV